MAGIAYLGGHPSFIGKVNSDEFGKIYKKSLKKINVNFLYPEKEENLMHLNPTDPTIITVVLQDVYI